MSQSYVFITSVALLGACPSAPGSTGTPSQSQPTSAQARAASRALVAPAQHTSDEESTSPTERKLDVDPLIVSPIAFDGYKILKNIPHGYSDDRLLITWSKHLTDGTRSDWHTLNSIRWHESIPERRMPAGGAPGDEYWGFADTSGNVVVDMIYYDAHAFSEGFAAVNAGPSTQPRWGMIDPQGNVVIPFEYEWLGCLSEGLIPFSANRKFGYIDVQQNVVIRPRFGAAFPFHGKRAVVTLESLHGRDDPKVRWIDRKGNVSKPRPSDTTTFPHRSCTPLPAGPLFRFQDGDRGRWGYKDARGSIIIAPRFEEAWSFSEGVAPVDTDIKDGVSEYIDERGNVLFTLPYEGTAPLQNGRIVRIDGGWDTPYHWAVYDATGKLVFDEIKGAQWPPRHIALPADQNSGTATVPPPNKKAPAPKPAHDTNPTP